jgi:hypothetical protein
MTQWLLDAKKFVGALAGAVAVAISSGLLSGTAERWTTGVIAAVTAFIVWLVPNGSADPEVPPDS